MTLRFKITTGSNIPIYRQLADQVRMAVAGGSLNTGDQLPSVRALAEQLVINPNTVARSYADLVQEGVLESQAGKGLFVAARQQKFSHEERLRRLHLALDGLLGEVLFLDFTTNEILDALKQKLTELDARSRENSAHD